MGVFRTVDRLHQGLSGASLRQSVLSNNLSNANTPGFKRSDVNFIDQMKKPTQHRGQLSLARTHSRHIPHPVTSHTEEASQSFHISEDSTTTMRNDGNNVDVDREMVMVMENQLHYQAMADTANRRLTQLRGVIGEGR